MKTTSLAMLSVLALAGAPLVGCSTGDVPETRQSSTSNLNEGDDSYEEEAYDEEAYAEDENPYSEDPYLHQAVDPVTVGAVVTIVVAGITATYCYLMKRECTLEKAAGQCEDRGYGKIVKVKFSCFPSGQEGSCEADCQVNGAPEKI